MKNINLRHIIAIADLQKEKLSRQLFPDHKYPYKALNYIETGRGNLDSWQLAKLAEILNVPIGLLYEDASWYMSMPPKDDSCKRLMIFRTYDFTAQLDLGTMQTRVSENKTVFFETVQHEKGVLLTEYLGFLTDLIIKYKQK